MYRVRAVVMAILVAASVALTGCNDSAPSEAPGSEQDGGGY